MQRSINMTYFLDMYPRLVYQQIRKDNDTRKISLFKIIIRSSIFFCMMTDLQIHNISFGDVYIFRYCPLINVKGYRQNKSTNGFHQIKAVVNLTEWNKKHVLHNLGFYLIINAQLNEVVMIYVQSMSCFKVLPLVTTYTFQ